MQAVPIIRLLRIRGMFKKKINTLEPSPPVNTICIYLKQELDIHLRGGLFTLFVLGNNMKGLVVRIAIYGVVEVT